MKFPKDSLRCKALDARKRFAMFAFFKARRLRAMYNAAGFNGRMVKTPYGYQVTAWAMDGNAAHVIYREVII